MLPLFLFPPLLLLSLRSFSGWVGLSVPLFLMVKEEWFILFVVYGYQEAEDDSDQLLLTEKLLQAVLA